jgi:hypothetical protein
VPGINTGKGTKRGAKKEEEEPGRGKRMDGYGSSAGQHCAFGERQERARNKRKEKRMRDAGLGLF